MKTFKANGYHKSNTTKQSCTIEIQAISKKEAKKWLKDNGYIISEEPY